jgi:hypothetical protein
MPAGWTCGDRQVESRAVYDPHFERLVTFAVDGEKLVESLRARREFQELAGKFEEDEPWFEQRMTLFLEWFVLDRRGRDGLTPAERFIVEKVDEIHEADREIFEGLIATQRTLARIERLDKRARRIELLDMIGGCTWSVLHEDHMAGLLRGDFLDVRIVPFRGELMLGRGIIFHPRAAQESIQAVLEAAHATGHLTFDLVDLLASQRLRFERYRNIKVQHIYRVPETWSQS